MPLHFTKRVAILQWWNSLPTSNSLQHITELTDGKYFWDIINSVFDNCLELRNEAELPNEAIENRFLPKDYNEFKNEGEEYPMEIDDLKNETEKCSMQTIDFKDEQEKSEMLIKDSKDEQGNFEMLTIDSKDEQGKFEMLTIDSKDEQGKFEMLTIDSKDEQQVKFEIQINDSKDEQENSEIRFIDSEDGMKVPTDKIELRDTEETTIISENSSDKEIKDKGKVKSLKIVKSSDLQLITMRYKVLQDFINEKFNIDSKTVISYEKCMKSIELELAKVAVLVLSLVVNKFLNSGKSKDLNTLTLLDFIIQEDIEECLALSLRGSKITRKDLNQILSKPARYKTSPRKSPRSNSTTPVTAQRKCSSVYKKPSISVTSTPPAVEEVFSSSPLKTFFDSTQFQNQVLIIKNKELAKTRKFLNEEEMRNEDLQLELNNLKKKFNDKERENRDLKRENKNLRSGKVELEEQLKANETNNEELIQQLNLAKKSLKDYGENIEQKDYESEIISLENKIKMYECQITSCFTKISQTDRLAVEIKMKEEENIELVSEIKALKEELKNEIEMHSTTKNLLHEKITEAKAEFHKEPIIPVNGENLGNIIEGENELLKEEREFLHAKLVEAMLIIEKLIEDKNDSNEIMEQIKQKLIYDKNKTDTSLITLLDMPILSKTEKEDILQKYPEIEIESNINSSRYFENAGVQAQVERNAPRRSKRNSRTSKNDEQVINNELGALWAQYNVSGSEFETSLAANPDSLTIRDIFQKLGFSEDEYSSKVDDGKTILNLLKEFFSAKNTNESENSYKEWEAVLNCDEECIKCLYHFKDLIFKLQDNSFQHSMISDGAILCNCKSISESMKHLKKENDELKERCEILALEIKERNSLIKGKNIFIKEKLNLIKQSDESLKVKDVLINEKDANITKLMDTIKDLEQQKENNFKVYGVLEKKSQDIFKTSEDLKVNLKMKSADYDELKMNYVTLQKEKNHVEQYYRKKLCETREKLNIYNRREKEFRATLEKEKKCRDDLLLQLEGLRYKCEDFKFESFKKEFFAKNEKLKKDNKCLSITNNALIVEISNLNSQIMNLKEQLEHHSKDKKFLNINVNIKEGNFAQSSSGFDINQPSTSYAINNEIPLEAINESLTSNNAFNKSLHSSMMIEEEDGYMSHSSLLYIENQCELKNLEENRSSRIQELRRRNTLYLPHLQSTYPVEIQSLSPFSASVFQQIEEKDDKDCTARAESSDSHHALKKRKREEMETENEAGPSQMLQTPDSNTRRKTFKTPVSLSNLLTFRRKRRTDQSQKKT